MTGALRILAARWFDGERLRDDPVWIDVAGETIARVRPAAPEDPPGAPVLDLRAGLVLPGLVNAHAHLARGGMFEPLEPPSPLQVARNLSGALAGGVTTVADMGSTAGLARALRGRMRREPGLGPQIVTAGPVLTAPEGYPLDWVPDHYRRLGAVVAVADERAARAAVERVAAAGMDFVKLMVMHRDYAGRPLPALAPAAARAAVEEAHRLGLRAFAHAVTRDDWLAALDAGVDALMHSCFEPLDAETLARVRDAGVPVCPTLWVFESFCAGPEGCLSGDRRFTRHVSGAVARDWARYCEAYAASGDVLPDGIATGLAKASARDAVRAAAANLVLLEDAGVPLAFGNDAAYGFCVHGRPVDELSAMQRAGLDAVAVLHAATSGAADLLGLSDRGRIQPGQRADVICVDPRAASDAAALAHVLAVVSAGQVASHRPGAQLRRTLGDATAAARGLLRTALTPLLG